MGYLRKECQGCAYWKKLGEHCGAIMHGLKCVAGPWQDENARREAYAASPSAGVVASALYGPHGTKANDTQVGGDHYKKMGVQVWDVVDTWPLEQRIGYYRGGALKYLMRMGSKDQNAQEIAKGKHYMEKLLEVLNDA